MPVGVAVGVIVAFVIMITNIILHMIILIIIVVAPSSINLAPNALYLKVACAYHPVALVNYVIFNFPL